MEKQTIKEAYQKFTVKDSNVEGVSGESVSKGTGMNSQVPDGIIRDGSHMHKDRTLKPMLSIKQENMSIYMRQTTWGGLKSLMQMT